MGRKKHLKQAEVRNLLNVFDPRIDEKFKLINEIIKIKEKRFLEVGCGKGEYSIYFAENNPDANCFGIDRAGARIWRASKNSAEEKLNNVFFILCYVEIIEQLFPEKSIDYILVPFPNPVPYSKKFKKVLYNDKYLNIYMRLLKSGGGLLLKTDDEIFFSYALKLTQEKNIKIKFQSEDLYSLNSDSLPSFYFVKTTFEFEHLKVGKKIKILEIFKD